MPITNTMILFDKVLNCLQGTFVRFPRAVISGIDGVVLSPNEQKILNRDWSDYLFQSKFSQSVLAWRRRNLYLASAFMLVSVLLKIIDLISFLEAAIESSKYSPLGLATVSSRAIVPLVSFAILIAAAFSWTKYKRSRDMLVPGWVLGLVLLLWPNLVPVEYLLKDGSSDTRVAVGITNSLAILPMYLAIAGGMAKGARKVHVFSASSLTGSMIVMSAAFGIVIPFATLSLVIQIIGDVLFLVGALFIFLSPIVILLHAGVYTEITDKNTIKQGKVDKVATALLMIGFILILVWAFLYTDRTIETIEGLTGIGDDEKQEIIDELVNILDPVNVVEKVIQSIGNFIYQSVLWTDIFLFVSRNDDAKKKKLTADLLQKPYRAQLIIEV